MIIWVKIFQVFNYPYVGHDVPSALIEEINEILYDASWTDTYFPLGCVSLTSDPLIICVK